MKRNDRRSWVLRIILILLAGAAPTAFPLAEMGYFTLHQLAGMLIVPSAALLLALWGLLRRWGYVEGFLLRRGIIIGLLSTVALEAIRYTGFRVGYMPGNLPELMGVLLLDRFALGPSFTSTLAGFAYHFWNGACLGMVFSLLIEAHSRWWAIPYGIAVGVGFLVSPVVEALGVGIFGKDFGWHFAATVLAAHTAFGLALGALTPKSGR